VRFAVKNDQKTSFQKQNKLIARRLVVGLGMLSLFGLSAIVGPTAAQADVPARPEVIVQIAPDISIATINATFGTVTLDTLATVPISYLLQFPAGADPEAVTAAIAATPGVTLAQPNGPTDSPETNATGWIFGHADSTPTQTTSQYAEGLLNLAAVRQRARGAGVLIAVLDTGVQANHPDLANSLSGVGVDLVDNDYNPADTRNGIDDDGDGVVDEAAGHGTHVAGIVHRVAPDAKIMPIRVLNSDGVGDVWAATKGMYLAADNGAKIINMSLGAKGSAELLRFATDELTRRGIVVVAAAGNSGKNVKAYPAAAKCAISVAATNAGDAMTFFSTFDGWVDVAAPGEDVHSAYPFSATGYASWTGTSMASPFVAGQAALLVGANNALRPNDVFRLMVATAKTVANPSPKTPGRIDIMASLDRANNVASLAGTPGLDDRCN
jgi:subtilisin family serine protease